LGRYAAPSFRSRIHNFESYLRLLSLAISSRSGFTTSTELPPPDLRWLDFVYELSDIAGREEDVRERIFGGIVNSCGRRVPD
jgi:hypothetical protein